MSILHHQRSSLFRLLAALGVAMVVWLNFLVASPGLHAWFHRHGGSAVVSPAGGAPAADGGDHPHAPPVGSPEHHCAVTLFAGGVEPLVFLELCGVLWVARCVAVLRPEAARAYCTWPRYWHVPAVGPPTV